MGDGSAPSQPLRCRGDLYHEGETLSNQAPLNLSTAAQIADACLRTGFRISGVLHREDWEMNQNISLEAGGLLVVGRLVVLEGLDKTGKTTRRDALEAADIRATLTPPAVDTVGDAFCIPCPTGVRSGSPSMRTSSDRGAQGGPSAID
jgi:hypothetical protein